MKKLISTLCIAVMLLGLVGCEEMTPDGGWEPSQKSEAQKGNLRAYPSSDSFAMVSTGGMYCSSENGYYYIPHDVFRLKDGSFAYHMMYMDYGTKKEIYLCNRSGCSHDTAECPAVFTEKELNISGSLFIYDGLLYVFSHPQDQEGITTITQHSDGGLMQEGSSPLGGISACLYRMNLDGTDRKQVFSFDSALSLEDIVLSGDQSLYFVTKKLSSDQIDNQKTYVISTERKLIKLDTKSWKASTVCNLDSDWKIEGCFNGKLIFSQILFDHELSKEELHNDDTYLNAYKNSQTQFSILDPTDGKTENILKLPNKNLNSHAIKNGKLYVSTQGEGKIREIDLEAKRETTFAELNASQVLSVYQDVLLCSEWDEADGSSADWTMYFIHLNNGQIDKSALKTPSLGWRIDIRAEMKDSFLVIYDHDAQKDTSFENDQYNINGYKYALIQKEDLYTGKANYHPIEMIDFGE